MNAREQAIEVMARALHADEWGGEVSWEAEQQAENLADYWRGQAAAALDALLAATRDEPCPECRGEGKNRAASKAGRPNVPCAECDGYGRVPGAPLVILGPERVGAMTPLGNLYGITAIEEGIVVLHDDCVPLYRVPETGEKP